jgi:hypothetical protein
VSGAVILFVAGATLFVATLRLFATEGRGTLAPWDPPAHLVVRGPYRFVRNPMISGVLLIITAEALFVRSPDLARWALLFLAINMIYIPLLEEPQLQYRFGDEYRAYKRSVPRFLPRLTPWTATVAMVFALFAVPLIAQRSPASKILGQWRGTSTCVRIDINRACNDEVVLYDVVPARSNVLLKAQKFVEGVFEPMYEMELIYKPAADAWEAKFKGRRVSGIWSYKVKGHEMRGTCIVLPSKTVVRHVVARKSG